MREVNVYVSQQRLAVEGKEASMHKPTALIFVRIDPGGGGTVLQLLSRVPVRFYGVELTSAIDAERRTRIARVGKGNEFSFVNALAWTPSREGVYHLPLMPLVLDVAHASEIEIALRVRWDRADGG